MKRTLFFSFFVIISVQLVFSGPQEKEFLYIGTYSSSDSEGIYVFQFDREEVELNLIQTVSVKESPSFLSVHPKDKYLYAVYEEGNAVTSFKIDSTGKLSQKDKYSSEGIAPCHISVDPQGEYNYVSNYGDGVISVYPIDEDGSLNSYSDIIVHEGKGADPKRQKGPHMHSMIPDDKGEYIYASDLGTDEITSYKINRKTDTLITADKYKVKPGSGPRHFEINSNGEFAYSIEEITSTISVYSVKNGSLNFLERENLIPEEVTKNKSADIGISPDGNFLYASNRGHNSLVTFSIDQQNGKLDFINYVDTRGKTPRNFYIDKKGEFIFVANRNSNNIVIFRRNKETGEIKFTGTEYNVPEAVCIQQIIR